MIPDWVVVKRLDEVSIPRESFAIDIEEWPKIARERVNKFIRGDKWYPSRSASRGSYDKEIYEEFAGHGLLRLTAAENTRIFGWLIEQEGDLFEWRYLNAKTTEEKIDITKYFFGKENVIDPQELWKIIQLETKRKDREKNDKKEYYYAEFGKKNKPTSVIGIHFSCVPKIISNRSMLLTDGWVLGKFDDFANAIKIAFERLLRDRIKESGERMDRTIREPVRILREDISKLIFTMHQSQGKFDMDDYDLYNRQDIFPQCMLDLYNEVMSKGHIGHSDRFQLGLFLKKMGMSVDAQLKFWYNNAVDNVGMTYEQFAHGPAGYIIRHMYGLEGGEVDYDAPGCSTIQGEYYCTFNHQSIEEIDKHLRSEFKNPSRSLEEAIRNLESKVVDKKPSEACAMMFNLRYHKPCKPTWHPISYSTYAARMKGIIKRTEEPIKKPPRRASKK